MHRGAPGRQAGARLHPARHSRYVSDLVTAMLVGIVPDQMIGPVAWIAAQLWVGSWFSFRQLAFVATRLDRPERWIFSRLGQP
jgi:hypothetical protein